MLECFSGATSCPAGVITVQFLLLINSSVYMEVPTQRRVHQDGVVKLSGGLGDVDRLHLLEAAQRVTLRHQFRDGPLVEGAGDQQDDVIDHIAVPGDTQQVGRACHDICPLTILLILLLIIIIIKMIIGADIQHSDDDQYLLYCIFCV